MLPAGSRLTRRDEFTTAVRRGRRAGRPHLVVHLYVPGTQPSPADAAPRAGFVVSRAVGGSVARHRVVRRLRHLVQDRIAGLPVGARLVVRALPPAAAASSRVLAGDLDSGLRAVLRRVGSAEGRV